MFYIVCGNLDERSALVEYLKQNNIYTVFHYLSLHKSPYYSSKHDGRELPYADYYSDRLLRLPMYYELSEEDAAYVSEAIITFYKR
jgi:dTDP-4-amino-4,6-dideoxygalactose transaminase